MAGVEANDASSVDAAGKDTMWFMLVGIAALSFFLTVIPLFFYKFNEKQQQEAVAEIKKRKIANGEISAEEAELEADEAGAAQIVFPNEDSQAVALEEDVQLGDVQNVEDVFDDTDQSDGTDDTKE